MAPGKRLKNKDYTEESSDPTDVVLLEIEQVLRGRLSKYYENSDLTDVVLSEIEQVLCGRLSKHLREKTSGKSDVDLSPEDSSFFPKVAVNNSLETANSADSSASEFVSNLEAAVDVKSEDSSSRKFSDEMNYRKSGVDIDSANAIVSAVRPLAARTRRLGAEAAIGGFGGLFDLSACGFHDPVLVAATDGVGTKLLLSVKSGIYETIGVDLVAMSVNDLIVQGAEPLFFLDYYATGRLFPEKAVRVLEGITTGCLAAGCALIGGETAEMPGLYAKEDFDLAGFSVGAVERGDILPRLDSMKVGDKILGLASSGPHANGYSLIRKIVEEKKASLEGTAPFAPEKTLVEALLEPTRIYVPAVLKALRGSCGKEIHGLCHITGGGFLENLPRVLPSELAAEIAIDSFPFLPVFEWLQTNGEIETQEMLRTFNCGIGMVLIVASEAAERLIGQFTENGEQAYHIGTLTLRDKADPVTIRGAFRR